MVMGVIFDLKQSLDFRVYGNSRFTNKPYIISSCTLINEIKKPSSIKRSNERKNNNMHFNIDLILLLTVIFLEISNKFQTIKFQTQAKTRKVSYMKP